jgi:error-prone DNA polymerase
MGFYSPRSLVEDARRHGVEVYPADVQRSGVHAELEKLEGRRSRGLDSCISTEQPPVEPFVPGSPDTSGRHRRDGSFAVRLGLAEIRGLEAASAKRIVEARAAGPFLDLADLARRADLDRERLEALASAGACSGLGIGRRQALWAAAPASDNRERFLPGIAVHVQPPLLPVLTAAEQTHLDLWTTGVALGTHPVAVLRERLDARGVVRSDQVKGCRTGSSIEVAGLVTHRQRPSTSNGVTFVTLEDEAGTVNIVTWRDVWQLHRSVAQSSPALIVRGVLERSPEGVANIIAGSFEALPAPAGVRSRDFR